MLLVGCSSKEPKSSTPTNGAVAQQPVGNPVEGKVLYTTCAACHGEAAQGNQELNAPTLVNSDSWYLYRQLTNFQKGVRGYLAEDTAGLQMAAMAKALKDSITMSHVVAYIKTLPETDLPALIQGDVRKGERTYQSICGACHGPGAKGNEKMNAPRLNGLDDWYLKQQMKKFKASVRGAHPADKFGLQMVPMMALLADEQAIDDVIAYIRSTTQPSEK